MRLASFNVENLFDRARALNRATWAEGRPALAAFERFNRTAQLDTYSAADRVLMIKDLTTLGVLSVTAAGSVRLNTDSRTGWGLLRENRGDFLRQPNKGSVEIVASGRGDWIGWVELQREPVDEIATQATARVINDVDADVLAVIEADNRPALVQFNTSLLGGRYAHTMLVDGNDPRGIDVGIYTKTGYTIGPIISHVDDPHPTEPKPLFSRDCPVYRITTPNGPELVVLVNHLKSQSRTFNTNPDDLRHAQATRVRQIYDALTAGGDRYVAIVGDLNHGPDPDHSIPVSLEPLFTPGIIDTATLPGFDSGPKPGTWQTCSLRNRLDYILVSPDLAPLVTGGGIFRKGLWGNPTTKSPPGWDIYPEITRSLHAASDHAAVYIDVNL